MALPLWRSCAAAGAGALGLDVGVLAPGRPADLVVLDGNRAPLEGLPPGRALDAWLVGGSAHVIREVRVGGRLRVEGGELLSPPPAGEFAAAVRALLES